MATSTSSPTSFLGEWQLMVYFEKRSQLAVFRSRVGCVGPAGSHVAPECYWRGRILVMPCAWMYGARGRQTPGFGGEGYRKG